MVPNPSEPLNQLENNLLTTENNEENWEKYSQKYVYKFDDPLLQDYGYVQVINDKLIVQFPVKPDHTHSFKPMHHVQFYFNNEIRFSSDWLPILTLQDLTKFKTMLYQTWYEYSTLTQYKYWSSSSWGPFMHSELVTIFNRPSFYLSCFESHSVTLLELETKISANKKSSQPNPVHVQFYFGPHLVFCSETHLKDFSVETLHFVLSFVLQKIII